MFVFFRFILFWLSPRGVLCQVRIAVALAFGDLVDVILLEVEFGGILELVAYTCAVGVIEGKTIALGRAEYIVCLSPAADVERAVSFGSKFYDTFLLDGLEEFFFVGIFVGS